MYTETEQSIPDFALHTREFYRDPHPAYALLRRRAPVYWCREGGFWALTRFADIKAVSRDSETFSSERGLMIGDLNYSSSMPAGELERLVLEGLTPSDIRRKVSMARVPDGGHRLLATDAPLHSKLRRIVSKAFTPRVVSELQPRIEELAREVLDQVDPGRDIDFIDAVAAPIPTYVIAELLGIDRTRRRDFRRWSDACMQFVDEPDPVRRSQLQQQIGDMLSYLRDVIAHRHDSHGDDLISLALKAEIDGERLSDAEVLTFCIELLNGGNETTRHLIAGATFALATFPDQRRKLVENAGLVPNAIDEFIRWVTPFKSFGRTAMRDVVIRDQVIREGDFVLMLYASANRDEDVWERSNEFDVSRKPDPMHLAFGWGPHACLGANLARLEARIVFRELLERHPRYELAAEPTPIASTLINGFSEMPIRLSA